MTTLDEVGFSTTHRRPPVLLRSIDEMIVALLDMREGAVAAYTRMTLARNGFPVGGANGGSGISDPTGAAATRYQHDLGTEALKGLRADLDKAQDAIRGMHRRIDAWQPRSPGESELAATETVTVECCVPCHGHGYFAPFHIHSDAKRNLLAPMALCQWHYRWLLRFGSMPNSRQVEDHHRRGKSRVAV